MSRATIRTGLADLLRARLVDSPLELAERVYSYQRGDFIEQLDGVDTILTPVVIVTSAGSDYASAGQAKLGHPAHRIEVHTFVLYANSAVGWSEEQAEQRADELMAEIYRVILANRRNLPHWQSIQFAAPSETHFVVIGGVTYRQEILVLLVRVPESAEGV